MDEQQAIELLSQNISTLDNPGIKYIAATRLGACSSRDSLDALVLAATGDRENIFDSITRRKSIEALGRRRDLSTLPTIYHAMSSSDEQTIVNAVDTLINFGVPLDSQFKSSLLKIIQDGSDVLKRVAIQCFSRLEMHDSNGIISKQQSNPNILVNGASIAYSIRVEGDKSKLQILADHLENTNVIYRRSSVIDIGDAGEPCLLSNIAKVAVSMPLRAKSAFKITPKIKTESQRSLINQMLQDDSRHLCFTQSVDLPVDLKEVCDLLRHRDEERQYSGAKTLFTWPVAGLTEAINSIWENHGSDYGVHYQVNCLISQLGLTELSFITKESLSESAPQYAKSKIAATWGCLNLGLSECRSEIENLFMMSSWEPLRWTCAEVLRKL
uniref:HEAT repeat domain-containing protein n=1 Tax=Synechococcus sp. UW106 TaxID=368495 RepID=UPI0014824250|nr:HEAT repeat domain-containing protein [Synechococcus sp. UW106]